MKSIIEKRANSISEVIKIISDIKQSKDTVLYYRGESKDYESSAITPSIFRGSNLENEHLFYREMQRFNEHEFLDDKTTFDKLSRMQHYECPTRLLDISEDVLSACFFALQNKKKEISSVLYVFEIYKNKIKYYDSDSVSVVANLVKTPLENRTIIEKSKKSIWELARKYLNRRCEFKYINNEIIEYLLHDIKEEKSYFTNNINPQDFFSIFCVKPKYSNQRIHGQKGAFLLYGMSLDNYKEPPTLIERDRVVLDDEFHPIKNLYKIKIDNVTLTDLEKLGINLAYIYPEMYKVSEYLKTSLK